MRLLGGGGAPEAAMLVVAESPERFGALVEELDAEFPDGGWASASPRDLRRALDGTAPEHVLIAVAADAADIKEAGELVALCRGRGVEVIVVVENLSASDLHRLMRAGAEDFLPVPVARGDLRESLDRIARRGAAPGGGPQSRHGLIYPVYGVAGGVGASVFAVNLAWELAREIVVRVPVER